MIRVNDRPGFERREGGVGPLLGTTFGVSRLLQSNGDTLRKDGEGSEITGSRTHPDSLDPDIKSGCTEHWGIGPVLWSTTGG
jgi:hypothetical protein